ncbi:MAG: phosphotransferase family protein [Paenisporosarcina sp.]
MERDQYIQLKPNVWKWQVGENEFSLKKYNEIDEAEKIRYIHEQLLLLKQSYVLPIEPYNDQFVIQQPWVENGKKVRFDSSKDREDSLNLLHKLHQTGDKFNWKKCKFLHEINLNKKWEHRLEKWLHASPFLHQHMGKTKTNRITNYAEKAIDKIKPLPSKNLTILHGDVVHHNFVRDKKGKMYLIDFDLACIGAKEVELILWMHRVLPHLDYEVHKLFQHHPTLHSLNKNALQYLLFPNELLREWLYASSLSERQLTTFLPKLKLFTEKTLRLMPNLTMDLDSM